MVQHGGDFNPCDPITPGAQKVIIEKTPQRPGHRQEWMSI
jgi:hypothetical protein